MDFIHVPSPFSDFALYPFPVRNLSHEYDYMLNAVSLSESPNFGVVLGTSDTLIIEFELR